MTYLLIILTSFATTFAFAAATSPAAPTHKKTSVKKRVTTTIETDAAPDGAAKMATTEPTTATPPDETPKLDFGDKAKAVADRATDAVSQAVGNDAGRRLSNRFSVLVEYSPLDLILPSKIGANIGYNTTASTDYELEYLGTSVSSPFFIQDIGGFSDKRISLIRRSFGNRNSFNVFYGLTYFDLEIHVGSQYLQSATNLPSSLDLMRSQTLGVVAGIGNRWLFPRGFTAGVDWLSWSQPIVTLNERSDVINYIKDEGAKTTLQNVFHISAFLPRITVLKVALGLSF